MANSDDLIVALQAGRLDLAFIGTAAAPPPGIGIRVLASELLVAVVACTDPLAAKTMITLTELAGRALISLPRGTGLRGSLEDACAAAGFRPQIAFEAATPSSWPSWPRTGSAWPSFRGPSPTRTAVRCTPSRSPGRPCAARSPWPGAPKARSARPRGRSSPR